MIVDGADFVDVGSVACGAASGTFPTCGRVPHDDEVTRAARLSRVLQTVEHALRVGPVVGVGDDVRDGYRSRMAQDRSFSSDGV